MERLLAIFLLLLVGASLLYLLVGFVIIPVIRLLQENARLK